MRSRKSVIGCASILFLSAILCTAEPALRSPWDQKHVQLTDLAYPCPPPHRLSPDLTTSTFYSDSKSSIIDPVKWKAYQESSGPYKLLGDQAVAAADAYQATGSRQAARCVLLLEKTAAQDQAYLGKMSSNQAYCVRGWVTGALGVTYLKVRDSGVFSTEDATLIRRWLVAVTGHTIAYCDSIFAKPNHALGNNHLYWADMQAGAVAIVANDRKLFDWAIAEYHNGIQQTTPYGALPAEMNRGQRALHYPPYAASPLVYIAAFGELNGITLYAENNGALKLLVRRATAGLAGSDYFDKQTGIKQDAPNGAPTGEETGWAKAHVNRFPDPAIAALITRAPSLTYMYLGGLPPY